MLGELLRSESELLIGDLAFAVGLVIDVGIDDELTFHGDRLVLRVVEVGPAAESARRDFAGLVQHGRAPQNGHPRRYREFALFEPRLRQAEPVFRPVGL